MSAFERKQDMARTPAKKSTKPKTSARKPAATKKPAKRAGSGKAATERPKSGPGAADALVNLLQSPLVADLIAVAATAAIGAIAEKRFSRDRDDEKAGGKAVKAAGVAAAAAIGRRLTEEVDAIRKASKGEKGS